VVTGAVYAFTHANGFQDMFWASVVFGVGGGIAMPALMAAAVLRGSRSDAMGSVMALLTVAHSLGMLLGSVLAGMMMDWFQLRQAFVLGALVMAAGTLLFVACTWHADLSRGTVSATPPPYTGGLTWQSRFRQSAPFIPRLPALKACPSNRQGPGT
jgi:DHA1 family multidrug resistance protein-like MFS transporter